MGRRLGQHFLFDPAILDRIVSALDPTLADMVVEVGVGKGTLTRRLAPAVGTVFAIEKDPALVASLRAAEEGEILPPNVNLVEGDALELDWHELIEESRKQDAEVEFLDFKVIGNIPYAITSPLIEKALLPPLPERAVFLMQREVADRLAAEPGRKAYGALTVGVRGVARAERLFTVRAGSFSPPPEVDSAVVRLTPLADPLVAEHERKDFRRFVGGMFGQRRKQLSRALRTVTGRDKDEIDALLNRLGADRAARPEVLSPEELFRIYKGCA